MQSALAELSTERPRAHSSVRPPRGGGDGVRAGRGGVGVFFAERDVADGAHVHARGHRAANVHHQLEPAQKHNCQLMFFF